MTQAGNLRLPADVLILFDVPLYRRVRAVGLAGSVRATEGRPVRGGSDLHVADEIRGVCLHFHVLDAGKAVLGGEAAHDDARDGAVGSALDPIFGAVDAKRNEVIGGDLFANATADD